MLIKQLQEFENFTFPWNSPQYFIRSNSIILLNIPSGSRTLLGSAWVCVFVCVCLCLRVCVCMCVRQRQRDRDRERGGWDTQEKSNAFNIYTSKVFTLKHSWDKAFCLFLFQEWVWNYYIIHSLVMCPQILHGKYPILDSKSSQLGKSDRIILCFKNRGIEGSDLRQHCQSVSWAEI